MNEIPPAELIEAEYDAMGREDAAATEAEQSRVIKEFHSANPAFIRGLSFEEFALAGHAFYFGLRVAARMAARMDAQRQLLEAQGPHFGPAGAD